MPAEQKIPPGLVDDLLALSTHEEQADLLRDKGLLDAKGLDCLLDVADRLAGDDPGKAQELAQICADLAENADAPVAVPRSAYIRVHTHNEKGEFSAALRMVELAHDAYAELGMHLEALRTRVGLMATLLELGRYQEAVNAGQTVLDFLGSKENPYTQITQEQADLVIALVHQNLGRCYEYMGRYSSTLNSYKIAENIYRGLALDERVNEILGNRGAILSQLGQVNKALEAYGAIAYSSKEAGSSLSHAKALTNIGEAHLRIGNYMHSLKFFEQARLPLETLGELADKYLLLRHTADAYLELNLYLEALTNYEEAIGLLRNAGMAHDLGQALWGKGSTLIAVSRLELAEEALAEAADLFAAAGNTPQMSGVMLEQAALKAARGEGESSTTIAESALGLVSEDEYPVHAVYARLRLADLLLPDVDMVESHLLAAQRLVSSLELPQLRHRLNERLGRLRRRQGKTEEALKFLEEAIEDIERLRGSVSQENMRASFLRNKAIAYEELLELHLDREDGKGVVQAFNAAERTKSRALVDLLTGVVEAGTEFGNPDLGTKIGELQADLNATYSQILNGSTSGEGDAPLPDLQARATELEGQINRLKLQAAATRDKPDLFEGTMPPKDIEERLPPGLTLLAYHVIGDEVLVFVAVGGHLRVFHNVGSVTEVQRLLRKLTAQWERLSANKDFANKHAALLERSARQVLGALYDELVKPLDPLLREAIRGSGGDGSVPKVPKLAVVPHGPLHQVPFHALFDGQRYLIERFEVSYAPSSTVFALCQEREPRGSGKSLVLGVEDPSIPATIPEAQAVAKNLAGAEVRVGEEATVAVLREDAPGCDVLHLATHGLFRSDNPMFSSLKLQDGWLMAHDVMDLDLEGALVVLSACESGRNEVIGGDETLGLTRAFLGAGAATLVVGLWIVQDETTAALMERWYARMNEGMTRTAALRAAQLEVKKKHPHPYYWAPFVLIGRR